MNLSEIEKILSEKISQVASAEDPAHDFLHFKRVVKTAKDLCKEENAKLEVVLPAAWLHDFVIIPISTLRFTTRNTEATALVAGQTKIFMVILALND